MFAWGKDHHDISSIPTQFEKAWRRDSKSDFPVGIGARDIANQLAINLWQQMVVTISVVPALGHDMTLQGIVRSTALAAEEPNTSCIYEEG